MTPIIIEPETTTSAKEVLEAVQALGYGVDTEGPQIKMLNMVQRRVVNARRWTFLLRSETKTLASGTNELTFTSQIARIDAIRLAGQELAYRDAPDMQTYLNESTVTGQPRYWTQRGNAIIIYPRSDTEYSLQVDYVEDAPVIDNPEAAIIIPTSHIDILVYGIIMQITFRERDWDGHNYARQMYAELFTEMLAQYGMQQRQQSSHVTSSGQWDMYDVEDAYPVASWLN